MPRLKQKGWGFPRMQTSAAYDDKGGPERFPHESVDDWIQAGIDPRQNLEVFHDVDRRLPVAVGDEAQVELER